MNAIQLVQITPEEFSNLIKEGVKQEIEHLFQRQQEITSNEKEFLTRKETKEFFSISYVCLHDWVKKDIITPYKAGTKTYFKRSELVDSLLSSNRRA